MALLHPNQVSAQDEPLAYWIEYIKALETLNDETKKKKIMEAWAIMDQPERFVFNKLITGEFRIGVSQKLLVKALALYSSQDENLLMHRLSGGWTPEETGFEELIYGSNQSDDLSKPYPFFLAYALDKDPSELGDPGEWFAERKWDGIRGQIIIREGQLFVWSRGEELVTDRFPEFSTLPNKLPEDAVIDGEILPYRDGKPLPFNVLQTRIGRKNVSQTLLKTAPAYLSPSTCWSAKEKTSGDSRLGKKAIPGKAGGTSEDLVVDAFRIGSLLILGRPERRKGQIARPEMRGNHVET